MENCFNFQKNLLRCLGLQQKMQQNYSCGTMGKGVSIKRMGIGRKYTIYTP